MKYQRSSQTGALREGVSDSVAEAIAADVLRPVKRAPTQPVTDLLMRHIRPEIHRLVPATVACKHLVVPIAADVETIVCAAAHPDDIGVDLTSYLTQARADQVIEVRGNGPMPHLHLDRTDDST